MPSTEASVHQRLQEFLQRDPESLRETERGARIGAIIDEYEQLPKFDRSQGSPEVVKLRRRFLVAVNEAPELLAVERFARFLFEQVQATDFRKLEWDQPQQVVAFCEIMYSFPFGSQAIAERVRGLVGDILLHALQQFEKTGDFEKMLELLRIMPLNPKTAGFELLRLRNRVHLYEMDRVRRHRRWIFVYLLVQALLVTAIFPIWFVQAENGEYARRVEATTEGDVERDSLRNLTYEDGVYWSIITASAVGYGDITPKTHVGRSLSAVLGVMGVISVGMVAGLLLSVLTPRRIE